MHIFRAAYDNSALIPEIWAQEALMLLENNIVATNLVHRDFEDEIADYGDVVNAHRPDERKAKRKTDDDPVDTTTTNTANIPVPLNQHIYDSFIIKDGERSKSFKELITLHLEPSIMAIAQQVDSIVCNQVHKFHRYGNSVGQLGTGIDKSTVIAARDKANQLRIPMAGRNFLLTSPQEADLLETDLFVAANTVGDDGEALREGWLGRKFGATFWMDQNMPSISDGNDVTVGAINNAGGYPAGTTTFTIDGSVTASAGMYVTIEGDGTPLRVVSSTGSPATEIVTDRGTLRAVADNAVVTAYTPGAVNNTGGYPADYAKLIAVDGFAQALQRGHLISFGDGTTTNDYGQLDVDNPLTEAFLDVPLAAGIADNDAVNIGPAGEYGMFFHRNAIALVTRPLAAPPMDSGANGSVASYNNLSIRVVMQYDSKEQGTRVNVDLLAGTAILDERLAFPVYG